MSGFRAYITGMGLITPVGLNTDQSCAAIRAGVSAYDESEIHNKRFEPMTMALLPDDALPPVAKALQNVPGLTSRRRRMLRLAAPALEELSGSFDASTPLPLFLGGPLTEPCKPAAMDEDFLKQLTLQTDLEFDPTLSKVFPRGRASTLLALQAALMCLAQGAHQHVLLGGVDTYLDLMLLGTLDQEDRILASGIMDGFAPGEAAGFFVLSREQNTEGTGLAVYPPGVASEDGHRGSDAPYTGDGLSNAAKAALPGANGQPISTVFSSMNGENLHAKEWGVTLARSGPAFTPDVTLEHPADCVGDTGAACGAVLLALAATGLRDRAVVSPTMIYCSSDGPERVAVCVSS
ncbi:MAG: hypothetical protein AB8G17_19005 [Gammaproteobacteria bacterium]